MSPQFLSRWFPTEHCVPIPHFSSLSPIVSCSNFLFNIDKFILDIQGSAVNGLKTTGVRNTERQISIAQLYPELAEKLEKDCLTTEHKPSSHKRRSSCLGNPATQNSQRSGVFEKEKCVSSAAVISQTCTASSREPSALFQSTGGAQRFGSPWVNGGGSVVNLGLRPPPGVSVANVPVSFGPFVVRGTGGGVNKGAVGNMFPTSQEVAMQLSISQALQSLLQSSAVFRQPSLVSNTSLSQTLHTTIGGELADSGAREALIAFPPSEAMSQSTTSNVDEASKPTPLQTLGFPNGWHSHFLHAFAAASNVLTSNAMTSCSVRTPHPMLSNTVTMTPQQLASVAIPSHPIMTASGMLNPKITSHHHHTTPSVPTMLHTTASVHATSHYPSKQSELNSPNAVVNAKSGGEKSRRSQSRFKSLKRVATEHRESATSITPKKMCIDSDRSKMTTLLGGESSVTIPPSSLCSEICLVRPKSHSRLNRLSEQGDRRDEDMRRAADDRELPRKVYRRAAQRLAAEHAAWKVYNSTLLPVGEPLSQFRLLNNFC